MTAPLVPPRVTRRNAILYFLAALGIILVIIRFAFGIGSVSNLSDGYPWGFWIGMDILAGIALAAGGFIVAGLVHILGRQRYHALSRPAILTAFLGYILFIVGLAIDLVRPWMIWQVLFHWNHDSPMFEVSWCVTMYTTVLLLEFLPVVFERFALTRLHRLWHDLVPWLVIVLISVFTFAMSGSVLWTIVALLVLAFWETAMRTGFMPRDTQMPIILIMAGVIFSTLHQSSLGSLLLIIPHKLHPLWFTAWLPVLFLISAVMMGAGMVIFEHIITARIRGHKPDLDPLRGFVKAVPWLLALYLVIKVLDVFRTGAGVYLFEYNRASIGMWIELSIGVLLPLVWFLTPDLVRTERGILWGAVLVVAGGIMNRLNTVITAVVVEKWAPYQPAWSEVAISVGIIAAGIIVLDFIADNFPVHADEHAPVASLMPEVESHE